MRTETRRCPVCRGLGFKGHGIWHILSDCHACDGTGKVEVHQRRPERYLDQTWAAQVAERRQS